MKKFTAVSFLIVFFLFTGQDSFATNTPPTIEYGSNYIVFEADATNSDLGLWVKRIPTDPKYYDGGSVEAIYQTYMEFTGNDLNGGPASSPLSYTFTCKKTANYRMVMRMYQPLSADEAGDKRNDVYVRLEGNYTTACTYPKSILETDHKFWGRGVRQWGSCHSLEAHVNDTKVLDKVVYHLTAGETYTFTISGRAQGCSLDYILFYEESLNLNVVNIDIATNNDEKYRPGLGLVDPAALNLTPDSTGIRQGAYIQLETIFDPLNSKKDLNWSSSDESILTVNENGKVTAVGSIGQTAIIKAQSTINEISDSAKFTIVEWFSIPAESIAVTPENAEIVEGSTLELSASVLPLYSDNDSVVWSSSDAEIADVNEDGLVMAHKPGTVTIRATSKSNVALFDEAVIEIQKFFEPYVDFDDSEKYTTESYSKDDSLAVTFNYHAGNFSTVKDGVKVWLREIRPNWTVAKEVFNKVVTETGGNESGTYTLKIPLADVTPTVDLVEGNFYFLFLSFTNSKSVSVNKGTNPINIVAANTTSVLNPELDPENELMVFPNPASNGVVYVKGISSGTYHAQIITLDGTQAYAKQLSVYENEPSKIDVSGLKSGMYVLQIKGQADIKSKAFIIK